jgi:hypothetical protein
MSLGETLGESHGKQKKKKNKKNSPEKRTRYTKKENSTISQII